MNKEILIVGLGLIGASYALKLKDEGYTIYAISRSDDTIKYAIDNDIIKEGYTSVNKSFVKRFDYVVLGLYPKVLTEWLEKYHTYFKEGAFITDVTGVKSSIVSKVEEILKDDKVNFIASHPMAGREVYGIRNAKKDLFIGANLIVTPTINTTQESFDFISTLGKDLGFKRISILTPEEHDKMIAYLSQLTHIIAISLMTAQDYTDLQDYTGDSFRDLTRIANINEDMWSELFLLNKEELVKQLDLFICEIENIKELLSNEDLEALKEKMRLSSERRKLFNRSE